MLLTGNNFTPAPAGGHAAVCIDFIDLGVEKGEWQGKPIARPKCKIVFEIDAAMPSGQRFIVQRKFTASLVPKGQLLPFLTSWRGKAFTADELRGFDTESLIDVPALLQIVHVEKGGETYANIDSIMFPPKGVKRLEASSGQGAYVRVKDRPAEAKTPAPWSSAALTAAAEESDDMPF